MSKKSVATLVIGAASLMASMAAFGADAVDTVAAFHAALATGDKAKALAQLSSGVAIYESGYVERSRAEYASHHLADDIAFSKATTRKVLKHSQRIDGNTAVVWEESETNGTWAGKDVHSFGTETIMLEKDGGSWAITHIHWSSRKAR